MCVHIFSKVAHNTRVSATTQTFVGGDGDEEGFGVSRGFDSASHHVGVTLEHHVESLVTKVTALLKACEIALHL